MIISKTPFRVSFFGGGTDYPAWYQINSGAVLSTTIDKYCYITLRYLPPFFEHKHRIIYSITETVKEIGEIKHPVVRALLEEFKIDQGVEIHHDGDLPARSGLGSSSAFTVGMLNALQALQGKMISKKELARQAIYIERVLLKENVGSQDQVAVAYGGLNKIIFNNDHTFRVEPLTLHRERVRMLQSNLMLVFTGLSRFASEIAAEQIKQTTRNEKELGTMQRMVDQAIDVLCHGQEINDFGRLMHESWLLKKSLSPKVSNDTIDEIYRQALSSGAIGGKILGAGGGGFMLLFVPPEKQPDVRASLRSYLEIKFAFENDGSQIIYYNPPGA